MLISLQRLISPVFFVILATLASQPARADVGWLDGDPNLIWNRSPGFYKDGDQWYAIIHAKPAATLARLAGDFTKLGVKRCRYEQNSGRLVLVVQGNGCQSQAGTGGRRQVSDHTQRGKWSQSISAGPCGAAGGKLLAGKQVDRYGQHTLSLGDTGWSPPEWNRHIIYQLHPLRFTARNPGLKPLQQVTEELNKNGNNDSVVASQRVPRQHELGL